MYIILATSLNSLFPLGDLVTLMAVHTGNPSSSFFTSSVFMNSPMLIGPPKKKTWFSIQSIINAKGELLLIMLYFLPVTRTEPIFLSGSLLFASSLGLFMYSNSTIQYSHQYFPHVHSYRAEPNGSFTTSHRPVIIASLSSQSYKLMLTNQPTDAYKHRVVLKGLTTALISRHVDFCTALWES